VNSEADQYQGLYDRIGYRFKKKSLIREALSHPSLESSVNYQRLEFVGDRVLGLIIAAWLYEKNHDLDEGGLASRHTNLVRRETCAAVARTMDLGSYIHMAKSTEEQGGREKETILSDVCESVLGAIFEEAGFEVADQIVRKFWTEHIESDKHTERDAKTLLQEWAQARKLPTPSYVVTGREGPAHQPVFEITVRVKEFGEEKGFGPSKREAEKNAAGKILERLVGDK